MTVNRKNRRGGVFGFLFRNQYMERKRRKSNWYIYFITLIISSLIAVMVVNRIWSTLFPDKGYTSYTGTGAVDYRPDASHNMLVLLMMSEMKAGTPDYFMLLSYRPKEETIVCIPVSYRVKSTVGGFTGNLKEQYDHSGAEGVKLAIENTLEVECGYYIKFDRMSFGDFVDMTGAVSVNIPYNILDGDKLLFAAGTQTLGGDDLYKYIFLNEFEEGEEYQMVVQSSAVTSMLNSNFRNLSTTYMQNYANKILNTTDTDFSFNDYTNHQQAFMYTSENSYNPAEYYIPYGDIDSEGYFNIAINSKLTIQDRIRGNNEQLTAASR